jgi:riboflavin kinase/FMN adenylyltransferase
MKVIEGIAELPYIEKAVVTSGTFDGVHLGHQKILKRLSTLAKKINGKSVVITFWPHPRFILHPHDQSLKLLTTFDEKAHVLEENGVDFLIKIPFTKEFSEMSSEDFINSILIEKLKTNILVIGYDHRFGHNREGSFEYLKKNEAIHGFKVEEISKQELEDVAISSTKIRNALLERDVTTANSYLGRPYTLTGNVVEGAKIGRTIGFPTANMQINESFKLVPSNGVYAIRTKIEGQTIRGMLNIGVRPTVNGITKSIEAHLFDFAGNLYGKNLQIELVAQIREERKFSDLESLSQQLKADKEMALSILIK